MLNKAILLNGKKSEDSITLIFWVREDQQYNSGIARGLLDYENDLISSSSSEVITTGFWDCIGTSFFGDGGDPGLWGLSVGPVKKIKNENTGLTLSVTSVPFTDDVYIFVAQNRYLFDGVEAGEVCTVTLYF